MNAVDVFLIIIFLFSVMAGYRHGFIYGVLDLLTWVAGLFGALTLYHYLADWLSSIFPSLGAWTMPVAFFTILLVIRGILSVINKRILDTLPQGTHNETWNKAGGMIPGAVNGLLWATIVSALLLALPIADSITRQTRDSRIAGKLSIAVEWLDEKLSPVFDEAVSKSINRMTVDPSSQKMVKLPFTVSDAEPRPDLEAEMLEMVNKERSKEGLPPLMADDEMRDVARMHSVDMFNRGYFSHLTPEGKTPAARMRTAGVRFLISGENLALGQTLSICHKGLMNSPGHRANILHNAYGRLGIGILDGGKRGLMITQNFRN